MALKAQNPFAPFWYTPISERAEEAVDNAAGVAVSARTRFKIRGLDGSELGYIQPEMIVDPQTKLVTGLTGKGLDMTLRYGLVDWENYANDQGALAFSPANFRFIDLYTRTELAMQIIVASYVTEDQKKTSPSP